jgi:shikimate kinase
MNIVFIGFMGSGKTVVGKALAVKLDRRFLDTDAMIEAEVGISIKEIFKKFGEHKFREIEHNIIKRAARYKNVVISCGGGAVLNPSNIKNLRKKGIIINLCASPEEIYKRIKSDKSRPLLNCCDPVSKIGELMEKRRELYSDCDYSFNCACLSVDKIVKKIFNKILDKL